MESLRRDASQEYLFEEVCECGARVEKQREESVSNLSNKCLAENTVFQQVVVAHEEIAFQEIGHNFSEFGRRFDLKSKLIPQPITHLEEKSLIFDPFGKSIKWNLSSVKRQKKF